MPSVSRSTRLEVLAPGHLLSPVTLRGYEDETREVQNGEVLHLKRGYKYRYSFQVFRGGLRRIIGGWFIVPERGEFEHFQSA